MPVEAATQHPHAQEMLQQSRGFVSVAFSLNKKVAISHNECFIHYPVVYQASKIHIIKVY